jgi:hypothetical protein
MSGMIILSCPRCGGNHLAFPDTDEEQVICEECGAAVQTLGSVKARLRDAAQQGRESRSTEQRRANRHARHEAEIEASQAALRASVAETDRLIGESEKMLRRHRQENDRDL